MAEQKEKPILNIYQKLQKARVEIQEAGLKKTGKGYSNFGYFELSDFLPTINKVCFENGLTPIFKFSKDKASLTIMNNDCTSENIYFETPLEMATIMKGSAIQQIGATQTYARRYVYMMAFEIAESDMVDSIGPDLEKEEANKTIDKVHLNILVGIIEETETNLESFLKFIGVKKLSDIRNKDYPECLKLLNKKKEEYYKKLKHQDKEKEAAKQQEELQKELEKHDGDFDF